MTYVYIFLRPLTLGTLTANEGMIGRINILIIIHQSGTPPQRKEGDEIHGQTHQTHRYQIDSRW
jgi:hypothetical protein